MVATSNSILGNQHSTLHADAEACQQTCQLSDAELQLFQQQLRQIEALTLEKNELALARFATLRDARAERACAQAAEIGQLLLKQLQLSI